MNPYDEIRNLQIDAAMLQTHPQQVISKFYEDSTAWFVHVPWYRRLFCKIWIHRWILAYERPEYVKPGQLLPAFNMCMYCRKVKK